jgi:hypothetical protein
MAGGVGKDLDGRDGILLGGEGLRQSFMRRRGRLRHGDP